MNQIDLSGKIAVVTGGTRGIGLAIAQRMVTSGARVAVWDRERVAKGGEAEDAGRRDDRRRRQRCGRGRACRRRDGDARLVRSISW